MTNQPKPEVKGIEQFRQVEKFPLGGEEVIDAREYAALFAFAEEQGKEIERLNMRLMQTRENLVIVRMQDYMDMSAEEAAAQLYSMWQDAVHKPHSAHPENISIAELESRLKEMEEVVEAGKKLLAAVLREGLERTQDDDERRTADNFLNLMDAMENLRIVLGRVG